MKTELKYLDDKALLGVAGGIDGFIVVTIQVNEPHPVNTILLNSVTDLNFSDDQLASLEATFNTVIGNLVFGPSDGGASIAALTNGATIAPI